jgi:WD40 repeat protein
MLHLSPLSRRQSRAVAIWLKICLLCVICITTSCIPVPVSTVLLHPREERPIALETSQTENYGNYSSPVYSADGTLLASYDSGSNLVRIYRSSDLTPINSLKPTRRPRRLSFSPSGHFLVIEAHQGWIDDFLSNRQLLSKTNHVDINSPEAVRDDIQRAEVWDLLTGKTIPDFSCDAIVTTEPQGGWLWARQWTIVPGYRSSALLEAHFSIDETEFLALCWNGVQQRWDSRTWERLENIPPPPFWDGLMGLSPARWFTQNDAAGARWFTQNDAAGRSDDGLIALLRIREKNFGFGTIYLWNRNSNQTQRLPGECASRLLPRYSLSRDGSIIVAACNYGLGYSIRAWNLGSRQEIILQNADFGFAGGIPTITGGGIALSPDGRYLAVALLDQMEALLPNVLLFPAAISRSDLRLWNLDDGKELVAIPIDELLVGRMGYFWGVDLAFSPDSQTLAVGGRRLRLYRLSDLGASPR